MKKLRRLAVILLAVSLCLKPLPITPVRAEADVSSEAGVTHANLVLFAHFKDDGQEDYFTKETSNTILNYYQGDYGRSFTNYMKTVSNGKHIVKNYFPQMNADGTITPFELSIEKSVALSSNKDYTILTELMDGLNLSIAGGEVDVNGDGAIDNVTVILVGESSETSAGIPTLWPHQSYYSGDKKLCDKNVSSFVMLNTERLLDGVKGDQSGLIIHEYLHTLGYPDLYRQSNEDYCVSSWDIMGQSMRYVSMPLAYLRQELSGWISLPELEKSAEGYVLNDDIPAVIIKSPGNPYEYFVVERRVKGVLSDPNSIDAGIGNTSLQAGNAALIVYRVDTTTAADGFSNSFGKTGVYVFRPGGEATQDAVRNAYLPNGTVDFIGSEDRSKGLTDGALTYTDGTNSGVVVKNIRANADGSIAFDVTIPDSAEFDIWNNTGLPTCDYADIITFDGKQYAAVLNGNVISLYKYENDAWASVGSGLDPCESGYSVEGSSLRLAAYNGGLYIFYLEKNADWFHKALKSLSFDFENNSLITGPEFDISNLGAYNEPEDEFNAFSVVTAGDGIYFNCVYDSNKAASLLKLENGNITATANYMQNAWIKEPTITSDGNTIYLGLLDMTNNNKVMIWSVNGDSVTGELVSPGTAGAGTYSLRFYNGSLYCALVDSASVTVKSMSDASWNDYASAQMDAFRINMEVAQGKLYAVTRPASSGTTSFLRVYLIEDNKLTQEGENVAIAGAGNSSYNLISSDENLFVSYVGSDGKAAVSRKTVANKLLSLTITPPNKTTYTKGETVSSEGMVVTANYVRGTTILTPSQYTLTDFNTNEIGERTAKVSFGGVDGYFGYHVHEAVCLHTRTEVKNAEKATCTEQGYTGDVYCKDCGIKVSAGNVIGKKAHEMTHYTAKEATCKEGGNVEYWYCSECKKNYQDEKGTTLLDKVETAVDPDNHVNTEVRNAEEATCTEQGYTGDVYCKDCGIKVSEGNAIGKKAHEMTHYTAKEATCKEGGNVEYWYCSECKKNYKDEKGTTLLDKVETAVDPDNHVNTEVRNAEEATCTEEGYTGDVYCKDCGIKVSEGTVIGKKAHEMTHYSAKEATCKEGGNVEYWYCSECKKNYKDEEGTTALDKVETVVDPDNHVNTEVRNAEEATCTKEGYTGDVYCTDCGVKVSAGKETPVDPTNHVHTEVRNAEEATCTEEGYTGDVYCTDCRKTIEEGIVIEKKAHEMNHYPAKEATCKETGNVEYWYCSECEKTYGDEKGTTLLDEVETPVDLDNHTNTEVRGAKEATCISKGYTGDVYCTDCGTKLSEGTETPVDPTNHVHTEVRNAEEATCTGEGYTGDVYCTDCDIKVSEGAVIEKKQHHYVDGVCDVCGEKASETITDPSIGSTTETTTGSTTETPAETPTKNENNNPPQTGDMNMIWLLIPIIVIFVAATGISIVEQERKRKQQNN